MPPCGRGRSDAELACSFPSLFHPSRLPARWTKQALCRGLDSDKKDGVNWDPAEDCLAFGWRNCRSVSLSSPALKVTSWGSIFTSILATNDEISMPARRRLTHKTVKTNASAYRKEYQSPEIAAVLGLARSTVRNICSVPVSQCACRHQFSYNRSAAPQDDCPHQQQ